MHEPQRTDRSIDDELPAAIGALDYFAVALAAAVGDARDQHADPRAILGVLDHQRRELIRETMASDGYDVDDDRVPAHRWEYDYSRPGADCEHDYRFVERHGGSDRVRCTVCGFTRSDPVAGGRP